MSSGYGADTSRSSVDVRFRLSIIYMYVRGGRGHRHIVFSISQKYRRLFVNNTCHITEFEIRSRSLPSSSCVNELLLQALMPNLFSLSLLHVHTSMLMSISSSHPSYSPTYSTRNSTQPNSTKINEQSRTPLRINIIKRKIETLQNLSRVIATQAQAHPRAPSPSPPSPSVSAPPTHSSHPHPRLSTLSLILTRHQ